VRNVDYIDEAKKEL